MVIFRRKLVFLSLPLACTNALAYFIKGILNAIMVKGLGPVS